MILRNKKVNEQLMMILRNKTVNERSMMILRNKKVNERLMILRNNGAKNNIIHCIRQNFRGENFRGFRRFLFNRECFPMNVLCSIKLSIHCALSSTLLGYNWLSDFTSQTNTRARSYPWNTSRHTMTITKTVFLIVQSLYNL